MCSLNCIIVCWYFHVRVFLYESFLQTSFVKMYFSIAVLQFSLTIHVHVVVYAFSVTTIYNSIFEHPVAWHIKQSIIPSVMQQIINLLSLSLNTTCFGLIWPSSGSDTVETATLHQCALKLHTLQSIYYYKIKQKLLNYWQRENTSDIDLLIYLLSHGAERFLRSCQLCSHSRTSQRFMKPEGSLPPSQQPSTGPYPEPDRSNPHHPILSL
jgi:hypothetical protein